jgi:hypothetical protein
MVHEARTACGKRDQKREQAGGHAGPLETGSGRRWCLGIGRGNPAELGISVSEGDVRQPGADRSASQSMMVVPLVCPWTVEEKKEADDVMAMCTCP